ncbi:MAG: metallophosphoesterase [Microbacteriaceae bacterium]
MSQARTATRTALVTAGVAVGGALVWATAIEPRLFTVRHQQAAVLAPGSAPIRVLHIADLHIAPWQSAKQEWLRSLASLQPDLIVNTGDNLGHPDGIEALRRGLGVFAGTPGVYVHGSNDYFASAPKNPFGYLASPSRHPPAAKPLDITRLEAFFDELGWQNINNAAAQIDLAGSRLEFIGTSDAHRGWDELDLVTSALDNLRENSAWQDGEFASVVTIGVTHAPYQRVLNAFVTYGTSLIFAGHTHGGQVRLPGVGALVTNCDLPRRKARGLSTWSHAFHSSYLTVSAGAGASIWSPVRFGCRPEATMMTLTPMES